MTIIGIDLGTSNSVMAYWDGAKAKIIPNSLGENLTPSIVSMDENGELFIGKVAKERLITYPEQTVALFKRNMGTEKQMMLGKKYYSAVDLSSFLLKKLKIEAEKFLNETIEEAVISVPAYFNDAQRKATKRAGELAGLRVERLISEPTAAALSYGIHERETDANFLVFDLGGGTYDVSILEKFEGVIQVRAIAGNNYLGGTDFTDALIHYALSKRGYSQQQITTKEKAALVKKAEICKRNLTNGNTAELVFTIDGQNETVKMTVEKFEEITHDLIIKLREPLHRAMQDASLQPNELDAVVLVGGATRMPLIKTVVSKMLGRIPFSPIDPDESVALGAAIQAALKQRAESLKEVILTDVCPFTLGTGVVKEIGQNQWESGYFFPIIERNTPIPISIQKRLYTVYDNQEQILVDVYQGESRKTKDNLKIGEVRIQVPPAPAGEEMIDVRYTYDVNGILAVDCISVTTQETKSIVIEQNPGMLTNEELEQQLEKIAQLKVHPKDKEENRLLLARGERLYEELIGDRRKLVANLLEEFDQALETQRPDIIEKAAKILKGRLDQLEGWNPHDY
ncbi:molecular chaperone HscC [Gracilibacillus oryzae]|uniref:Chaperone protein DnaK n=1 Tax=Gracilibacillus oryzae TaxID=1672701 RepID=A0A7C8GX44_9BACI|nr:molecular chaperone HscC [Gracilibacillus oryzae]KAB8139341.1 molecular chaperone HscC [Gracilibacillus oryzae]